MNAEITTKKVGAKWRGSIEGRPDLDETALSEDAVRRKMEQLRDQIGTCGAMTRLFGGKTCQLIAGHHPVGKKRIEHRNGTITWIELPPPPARRARALPRKARHR